jgi:hypothetical protein
MPHRHLPAWWYILDGNTRSRAERERGILYRLARWGSAPRPRLGTRIRHWLGLTPPDEPKDFEW